MNPPRPDDAAAPAAAWPLAWDPEDALARFWEILRSGCWSVRSPHWRCASEDFERAWAAYCGTRHALLVPSGSSAIELALQAFAIGPGDEVIVPALGWYATVAAVLRVGATPVFADVDPTTSCLAPESAAAAMTSRTRAFLVVHLHGSLCDMDALLRLASERKIPVIEDCAQAHGASHRDRKAGSMGAVGCYSFNQEKLLSVGEGGALVTNDDTLADLLYAIRTDGYRRPVPPGEPSDPAGGIYGRNLCVSEFVAGFLLSQLPGFEAQEAIRQEHADRLGRLLREQHLTQPLQSAPGTTRQAYYEYGFYPAPALLERYSIGELAAILTRETGIAIHRTDGFPWNSPNLPKFENPASYRHAKEVHERLLCFPHHALLTDHVVRELPRALAALMASPDPLIS